MDSTDRRRIRRTLDLAVDRSRVWALIRDPRALGSWLGAQVDLPCPIAPGDHGSFRLPDGRVRRAQVEAVVPSRRLVWSWTDPDEGGWSQVTLELDEPAPGRARLTVTEESGEAVGQALVPLGFTLPVGVR